MKAFYLCTVLSLACTLFAQDSIFTGGDGVMQRVRNSVVSIYSKSTTVVKTVRGFRSGNSGTGTGFFISSRGEIVTAHHVVDDATHITITTADRREYEAEIIGIDRFIDIALLRVKGGGVFTNFLRFTNSQSVLPGKRVIALGNPSGLDLTFTSGIVSAVNRSGDTSGNLWPIQSFIQIDAAINPGNSGGPLMDINGAVIGVNDASIRNKTGLNFAVPSHLAARSVEVIRSGKRPTYPFIGITVLPINQQTKDRYNIITPVMRGVFVMGVAEGTGAKGIGIEFRDIIVTVSGKPIIDPGDIFLALTNREIGESVPIDMVRSGKSLSITAALTERPLIPNFDPTTFTRVFLNFDIVRSNCDGRDCYLFGATYIPAGSQSNWNIKSGEILTSIHPYSPSGIPEMVTDDEQLRYLLAESVIEPEFLVSLALYKRATVNDEKLTRSYISGYINLLTY